MHTTVQHIWSFTFNRSLWKGHKIEKIDWTTFHVALYTQKPNDPWVIFPCIYLKYLENSEQDKKAPWKLKASSHILFVFFTLKKNPN